MKKLLEPPATSAELEAKATRLLKDSGAWGVYPTPLDKVAEFAKIGVYEDQGILQAHLKTLSEEGRAILKSAIQKLRGVADLRERAIFIPAGQSAKKEMFAKAHEIAHQSIEWHNVGTGSYLDTSETLAPAVKELFEIEANYCASELIFQVANFRKRALDYKATIDAGLLLADDHRASYQSTLWKMVEVQDEAMSLAQYYPIRENCPQEGYKLWQHVGSRKFRELYSHLEVPAIVLPGQDWFTPVEFDGVFNGNISLTAGPEKFAFEWSAWSNTYTLFVMLRRKQLLRIVSDTLAKTVLPIDKVIQIKGRK